MDGGTASRDGRGMTNLVGIVLLVGLTLVGAIAVVVVGSAALGAAADQTEDDTTEDSMREMSTRLDGVADSSVDEATSFQMEGDVNVSSAKIAVEAWNSSSGHVYQWERSLGTIVYEKSDGTRLAYQGGGLWEAGDGHTMIVNEPGLDYDNSTLDLSIVNVSRFNSISQNGEVIAKKNVQGSQDVERDLKAAIQDAWTGPDGNVPVDMEITIESDYADGWAEYVRNDMTVSASDSGRVSVSESGDVVRITFTDLGTPPPGSGPGSRTPAPPATGGSEYDEAMERDEARNALQVNQEAGNLTLMTAQVGKPVEIETVTEYRDPMDVVFAIDETGSMGWNDRDGERIDATKGFIDDLNASNGDRSGFVQFSTRDYEEYNCRYERYAGGWRRVCDQNYPVPQHTGIVGHHEVSSDFQSVKDELEIWENGGTNITRGIDKATTVHTNVTDPNEKRVMVLLTDGQNDHYGTTDQDTVDAAERAYEDHDITIYPVGLGDEVDEELLEDVATAGNGTYYHADEAGDLEDLFEQIAKDTKSQTVHQINRTRTVLRANQDQTTEIDLGGSQTNVNNPNFYSDNGNLEEEQDLVGLVAGEYLSFSLELQSCDEYETTDVNSTDDGELYRHTYCTNEGSETTTIDNSTADHIIIRDGDPVSDLTSELTTSWWHTNPDSFVGSYTDGSTFDLPANESIIALDVEASDETNGQSGYVLMHFEVKEIEDPPGDSVPGGDAPLDPITIGYSEVGVT